MRYYRQLHSSKMSPRRQLPCRRWVSPTRSSGICAIYQRCSQRTTDELFDVGWSNTTKRMVCQYGRTFRGVDSVDIWTPEETMVSLLLY